MARAFKCDECGRLGEGEPSGLRTTALQSRYVVDVCVYHTFSKEEEAKYRKAGILELVRKGAQLCEGCMAALLTEVLKNQEAKNGSEE